MLTINGIIQTVRDTTELVVGGMSAASSVCSRVYKSGNDSSVSSVRKYRLTPANPNAMRRGVMSIIV